MDTEQKHQTLSPTALNLILGIEANLRGLEVDYGLRLRFATFELAEMLANENSRPYNREESPGVHTQEDLP